ncbi:7435_t:CDS:2 [Acaulospora morrowiae]|uniref:7435_t:CDS:1 n=1 Tax=Acaulospora morrowiae TaxID=94023 RepID=A0A9N9FHH9_9GLOM|nr:7435_t:CDS:2 [Acaulospora morrowiae]
MNPTIQIEDKDAKNLLKKLPKIKFSRKERPRDAPLKKNVGGGQGRGNVADQVVQPETEPNHLKRGLASRHLTMISIGGTIGTGIFLTSGASIAKAGPIGALLAYAIIGVLVYFMITSLCEMATFIPISGSFNTYAKRFVDPALGFALGWNYWYFWSMTIAVEVVAAAIIMEFWAPNVPTWIWSFLFMVFILAFNLMPVKGYGESEYWFALIKVVTVAVFIIVGLLLDVGIVGNSGEAVWLTNYAHGITDFYGLLAVILTAGFSFQGAELVGIAAGESMNPQKNVPQAIGQVYWRTLIFYLFTIMVVGLLVPYNHPNLIVVDSGTNALAISPFTIVFEKTGLGVSMHIINFVILTTVLSAGSSGVYAASRALYNMACEGCAPKIFGEVSEKGVPFYAVFATASVGSLAFWMSLIGEGKYYTILLNISGVSIFIQWAGISYTHWRFRKAFVAQGRALSDLPYQAMYFPFGPIFACSIFSLLIIGQTFNAFYSADYGHKDPSIVITAYSGAPLFITLYLAFKIFKKTKVVPLMECDFDRGFDPNAVDIDEDQFDILTKMTAVMIKGGKKIRNVDFWGNAIDMTEKGVPGNEVVTEGQGQVVVNIPQQNGPMPGETPVVPVTA